jgi:hypothetical protein
MFGFGKRKASTRPTLRDARQAFQEQVDYWETRMFYGDPLFDQWMVDALEASKEGLAALDKLEEAGATTGKDEIVSTTPTHFSTVEVALEKQYGDDWRATYTLDGGTQVSYGTLIQAAVKQEAFEIAQMNFASKHPKKVIEGTVFSLARGK